MIGEFEMVKWLLFLFRCLVVCNGWICCGGEKGVFSVFWVDEFCVEDDIEIFFELYLCD